MSEVFEHNGFRVTISTRYVAVEQTGKTLRLLNYAMVSGHGQKVALRYDVVRKRKAKKVK